MQDEDKRDRLLALLAWWREAGVVDALDEAPVDWTARPDAAPGGAFAWPGNARGGAAAHQRAEAGRVPPPMPQAARSFDEPRPPARPGPTTTAAQSTPPSPQPAARPPAARREAPVVASAREAARSARTLEELEALLRSFDGCPLKATAKNLCFYRGSPQARLMVIGEAPGRDEDLAGKPFVGRAGQLLDRMLAAIGLAEADVHITNIVYWRPPGNRTPTPEEAQACRPFLDRQMELVAPEFVLTLGGPAAKAILDTADGILKVRGRWREILIGGRPVRVMPTLHPAYLLRQPEAKRQAWRDLLQLKAALDGATEGKRA
jgi:DNA polymerase